MEEGQARKGAAFAPLVLVIALVQAFLFVNANHLWGPDWPSDAALLYIALEAIFLGWLGQRFVPRTTVWRGLQLWLFGFTITVAVIYGVFTFGLDYSWPTVASGEAMPLLVYTIFFVAPVEELIFRGILPEEAARHERWRLPVLMLGTQALFAVFHLAAYGGVGVPMAFAFGLGIIWVYASRRWTLWFTMGSHAAYNLCILGILTGGLS